VLTAVFVDSVKNSDIPITISSSGNLMAKKRLELFSEVQGIFTGSDRDFKPGMWYEKGNTLISINADEHRANLRAQKSNLYNQIVLLLPDLRLDFQESFPNWEAYVRAFDIDQSLLPLPEPVSEKEKLFISGRPVFSTYYAVKNLEERLIKYNVKAPYSGVLTEALVTPGTLIRAGQKLGEFINTSVYELETAINASYGDLLRVGQSVELHNLDHTKSWHGKVIRINSKVDQANQTIQVFVQVSGKGLREGMYLKVELEARREKDAYEISRKLLVGDDKLFVVEDSVLIIKNINPVYFKENTVVVTGLENGTPILSQPVPGAHVGMVVKVYDSSAN
jgi:multidrug efflux pump subunit AcrA (membrane-fusion protein)